MANGTYVGRSKRYFVTCFHELQQYWMVCYLHNDTPSSLQIHNHPGEESNQSVSSFSRPRRSVFTHCPNCTSGAALLVMISTEERFKHKFGDLLIFGPGICSSTHICLQQPRFLNICRQELRIKALILKECTWTNPWGSGYKQFEDINRRRDGTPSRMKQDRQSLNDKIRRQDR